MKVFENLSNGVTKTIGRTGLKLQKHSPEILVAAGVIGVTATIFMACKATYKTQPIIEEMKKDISEVKDKELEKKEEAKAMTNVYFVHGKELVKEYWPAATLGVLSISSILCGHNISRKRNLAVAAAYKGLETSFSEYRKRVISEFGEDIDRRLKNGIEVTEVEKEDEKGKKTKEKVDLGDPSKISNYARFFDVGNPNWQKDPSMNLFFLKAQQSYANDLLKARGHIFLNEVYDMLGFERTKEGAVVGWVLGSGDDYVDFGMYDGISMQGRNFINGYEPTVLLDFNVDGLIYDKI